MSTLPAVLTCLSLFAGMMLLTWGGMELGRRFRQTSDDSRMIDTAVFALLGLLLGFAFAGAVTRLDARRQLVVAEAQAIAAAYQRIDILPEGRQDDLRGLFRAYVSQRLATVESLEAGRDPTPAREAAFALRQRIWDEGVAAQRERDTTTTLSALAALQEMSRVTTSRLVASRTYTPRLVLALLLAVALLSALVAGYAIARPSRRTLLHASAYAAAVSITLLVVLDIDNPRTGLVRLDEADEVLKSLLERL